MEKLRSMVYPSTVCFAGVVARAVVEPCRDIESLRGRMGESERQVEGLFESLLAESFENDGL
jgi:hypothetical protein